MNDHVDMPTPAQEHYASGSRVKLSKDKAIALRHAIVDLEPMLKKAQAELLQLPLRPIIDTKTMCKIFVRFATAQELQRILMRHTLGRVIVDVLPVATGTEAVVSARLLIATREGYVQLPTVNFASQGIGLGSTDFGHKQVLAAESRAIRRILREIGLRAEYEDDASEKEVMDSERTRHDDATKELDESEVFESEVSADSGLNLLSSQNLDDEDIPTLPVNAKNEQAQIDLPLSASGKAKGRGALPKKAEPKAKGQVTAPSPLVIPKKELSLSVNFEHKQWPDRRGTDYTHKLLLGLNNVRKEKGYTVEDVAKSVFGENHVAQKRMTSYMTTELEKMYQFHVIQGGK